MGACGSSLAWKRSFKQTCNQASAPRICFAATPDDLWTFNIHQLQLVPGECAEFEGSYRGSFVAVRIHHGGKKSDMRRRLFVRPGQELHVEVNTSGQIMIARHACLGMRK